MEWNVIYTSIPVPTHNLPWQMMIIKWRRDFVHACCKAIMPKQRKRNGRTHSCAGSGSVVVVVN